MHSRVCGYRTVYTLDGDGKVWFSGHYLSEDEEWRRVSTPTVLGEEIPAILSMCDAHRRHYFIDVDGGVWYTGHEYNGTLKIVVTPRALSFPVPIKDVAASWDICVFLSVDGELWMESIPHTNGFSPHMPLQLSGVKVKSVKAGLYKLVFLDVDGCIWTVKNLTEETWEKYEHSCRVVDVYAGYCKIVIHDEENMVWQSGPNGRLGLGHIPQPPGFHKMHENPIKMVSVSENHAIMLDFNEQVWTSSYYEHAQIGEKSHFQKSVRLINIPPIQMICAGNGHNLLLDHNGVVWAYGKNQAGQLGLGDLKERKHCTKIRSLPPIQSVWASYRHQTFFSMFLDLEGSIWMCGENKYGELGLGDEICRMKPVKTCFPKIEIFRKQKNVKSAKEVVILE